MSTLCFEDHTNLRLTEMKEYLSKGGNPNLSNDDGYSLLHIYVQENKIRFVKLLIDFGANVNCPDSNGITPLMTASAYGYIKIIQLLVDSGADVNTSEAAGSPLKMAVAWEQEDSINLLLSLGANPVGPE